MRLFQDEPAVITMLSAQSTVNAMMERYLRMMRGMFDVLDTLQKQAIQPIILKGIPLNTQLYGAQCLRMMSDVDVLIKPDELMMAHDCLLQLGYQRHSFLNPSDLVHDYAFLMDHVSELLYIHPKTRIAIDLKWRLSPVFCRASNWFDRSKISEITLFSQKINILNHEQNFLYLAMHAAKHGWEKLKWLLDLAAFYQKMPLCWPTVISLAQEAHAVRPLLEATLLLQYVLQTKTKHVPHTVLDGVMTRLRLHCMRSQWDQKPPKTIYKNVISALFLYSNLAQKKEYMIQLILLRTNALRRIGQFKKPSAFKLVFKKLMPFVAR